MASVTKLADLVLLANKEECIMKVNIKIDNKEVLADDSDTILEVAKREGIDIPTLCYLKGINTPASCRVCVVEVEGAKNLVASCSTKVKNGMVIKTNSTKVLRARKTALELLLSNHNKDCLSCPKNLKCEFQRLTEKFSCDTHKFDGVTSKSSIDDSNHAIVRDESKCILCGKCVAVCKLRQGCNAISKAGRGFETSIGTAFNKPLSDSTCVGCGQCVLVCPTGALTEKNDLDKILDILDKKDVIKVAQVAPAVRVAIGEEFGAEIGTFAEGKMVSALKSVGFDYVFDVNNGADFTVIEEANELLNKIKNGDETPLFTSCCPSWFNFCEKFYPDYVKNISSTKSPNEMLGSLVKYFFESKGKRVEIVSIMPCTAKKREIISRGVIDACLTTRELAKLIRLKGIDFNSLKDVSFDNPFGEYSGGAVIFGVTGGVTESALRYAVHKLTGKSSGIVEDVRYSKGVKEVSASVGDSTINLAIVHGLNNAHKVMSDIISGKKKYNFIEVMACTGGCVNGGGQPYVDYSKVDVEEVIKKRGSALYKADGNCKFKDASENPSVKKIYDEILKNDPQLIHKLLHYDK